MKGYLNINDFETSRIYAQELIDSKNRRRYGLAYLYKGKTYLKEKNYEQAIESFTQATEESAGKEGAEALYNIGATYREQENYSKSTDILTSIKSRYERYTEWELFIKL